MQKNHGRPSDSDRHVGDLGNVETLSNGDTTVTILDGVITLNRDSDNGISDRAIVIHAGEDNFSGASGNAGSRLACGIIKPLNY